MKRRLLRMEMERRKEKDGGKTAHEVRAAASRARLARAGFWRPSIMRIGGGCSTGPDVRERGEDTERERERGRQDVWAFWVHRTSGLGILSLCLKKGEIWR